MMDGSGVAFVAQLLIHVDDIKRALVIDYIVATFVHQSERILVLKFYLCVVCLQAFNDVISRA